MYLSANCKILHFAANFAVLQNCKMFQRFCFKITIPGYQWCHVMPKTSQKSPLPTAPPPLAAKGKGAKK